MEVDTRLLEVGRWLKTQNYRFVTVTPATHSLVNARDAAAQAQGLEDIFGWSRPFQPSLLPQGVLSMLVEAGAIEDCSGAMKSRVRYSSLDDELYVHSSYPTEAADAVFFGPDTYRFAGLIHRTLERNPKLARGRIVDIGCGAGSGGVIAYRAAAEPSSLILADINEAALRYAATNAALSGTPARTVHSDLFRAVDQPVDLAVSNPPYLADAKSRVYRDGGGLLGAELSLRIVRESLSALAPGGTLILYTASCIVRGVDRFLAAVRAMLRDAPVTFSYAEIDPDVFGEELALPAYEEVDRISVVGLVLTVLHGPDAVTDSRPRPSTTKG
jgi:methylase of polypeptide subunit release factors